MQRIYDIVLCALPILLSYAVWLLKDIRKQKSINEDGVMLLLRTYLIEYHKKWKKRGYITSYGLQNYLNMYELYHAKDDDGMIVHLKEEVGKLEIKTEMDNSNGSILENICKLDGYVKKGE